MGDFGQQFHTNGQNQGFTPVSTAPAREPLWQTPVGRVGYGSPVIGPGGTIVIGTLDDQLVAVNPDGTIRWRREITPGNQRRRIAGSPAIDTDGNIYIIATRSAQVADHRSGDARRRLELHSTLYSFDPDGNQRWLYQFPTTDPKGQPGGFTFSSPKIYTGQETVIFFPIRFGVTDPMVSIMVLDQAGEVVHRITVADYPPSPIVAESNIDDFFRDVWDFISSPIDFDVSGVDFGTTPLQKLFGWAEPTLAIVDFAPHEYRPIVVVEDSYKTLAAYRWQNNRLTELWKNVSQTYRARSTPAVFPNSTIALGQKDGIVALYHLSSGSDYAKPWHKASKAVYSPPVSFGRQIFAVAEREVLLLESDGQLLKSFTSMGTSLAAPALSGDFLYVSSQDGLRTFTFDLEVAAHVTAFIGGVSSPSIAKDGTIYAIDIEGTLWAFGRSAQSTKGRPRVRDHR